MMQDAFRKAGFVDICEKEYKWPIGPWARDQKYKEAGTVNYQHWMSGMEGWAMWLLCKFGAPEPWTQDEVIVYVAKLRAELQNSKYHVYERAYVFSFFFFLFLVEFVVWGWLTLCRRRVWARKPFPEEIEERERAEANERAAIKVEEREGADIKIEE